MPTFCLLLRFWKYALIWNGSPRPVHTILTEASGVSHLLADSYRKAIMLLKVNALATPYSIQNTPKLVDKFNQASIAEGTDPWFLWRTYCRYRHPWPRRLFLCKKPWLWAAVFWSPTRRYQYLKFWLAIAWGTSVCWLDLALPWLHPR